MPTFDMSFPTFLFLAQCLGILSVCIDGKSILDGYEVLEQHHLGKRASKKCMGDLGCFEITSDFFHPLYRPINVLPSDREMINTKFLLYTRQSTKQPEYIKANKKDIDKSYFKAERETKMIVHGWLDNNVIEFWQKHMSKEFLMHGDYNVIVVDWSGGNFMPYTVSTANTRVVGAEMAHLVNFLKDNYSLDPEKVHLMGHSLGGQIVGYAGERIKNLGRITSLDPAQPYFQNMPPSVRIDPTDALFVDVIHTDTSTMLNLGPGMSQLAGHVDFFPNGGNNHPGCGISEGTKIITDGLIEGVIRLFGCNHIRAMDFLMDSINEHQCRPLAFACPDYESFKEGRCSSCGPNGERCAEMGMNAINYKPFVKGNDSVKMYTITGAKSPYCVFMYQVQVKLQNSQGQNRKGSLKITIRGHKNSETFDISKGNIDLYPGSTYNQLLTTSKNLGDIESVTFRWDRSTWIIGSIFKQYLFVDNIKITPINEPDSKLRDEMSRSFCAKEKGRLESGKSFDLIPTKNTC